MMNRRDELDRKIAEAQDRERIALTGLEQAKRARRRKLMKKPDLTTAEITELAELI